jgi:hypothetical protein
MYHSDELTRTELAALVNSVIDGELLHAPQIDAGLVAKAVMQQMPPGEPQPIWLEGELEALAAEILRDRFDPVARFGGVN